MFGYASNETPELMPATLAYSHRILKRLAELRHGGEKRLEPDAKSQVSLFYENGVPVRATAIVVSTQHAKGMTQADVAALVKPVVAEVLPEGFITDETVWHINPTGVFEIGGPDGDAGLTGRKIIVDTYGGASPHGGGAFSGKDCTKVDRSAAYAAAIWPRTWWRPAWPTAAPSSSATPSAWLSPSRSTWTCTAPARFPRKCWSANCPP